MTSTNSTASMGLIGVGTMGAALALNIAEKGHDIALYNLQSETIDALIARAGELAPRLSKADTVEALVNSMPTPRAIILLVPAGAPVDASIDALVPLLEPGDTIIDGGNSDFRDTQDRTKRVEAAGLRFLGVGISGGEYGARHGPSMMIGGTPSAYAPIQPVMESIAAKYEGSPCAAHLGAGGAGHFTKTVHNGIEYADMQIIAELYGMLRDGEGQKPAEIAPLFRSWNAGRLKSYLVEIVGDILDAVDPETGKPVLDIIVDRAGQKGTGRWTIIEAVRLGQSASILEAAVGARVLSSEIKTRGVASEILEGGTLPVGTISRDDLEAAFFGARILAYAQGFRILRAADQEYDWGLDYVRIAEIWREGCIIRSALLDDIATAFQNDLPRGKLVLAPEISALVNPTIPALRRVVAHAVMAGLPVPALSSALSWFDETRQARGTADILQGMRDYFGRHGFERVDKEGTGFHGPWAG